MDNTAIKIILNTQKIILSGSRRAYKTEGLGFAARKIAFIDAFISRTAEGIFYSGFLPERGKRYIAATEDGKYTLFFCRGDDGRLTCDDLVFYKFIRAEESDGGFDRSLSDYLCTRKTIGIVVKPTDDAPAAGDLNRLYLVSGGDGIVNFPLLTEEQKKIVETEDANILVQGVAGSGKTNVCVEKIVYCACRDYRGKVLYTTYSRGLLTETRTKVELFIKSIGEFLRFYENGNVAFIDENHKSAIENKLGIPFDTDDDAKIISSLKRISVFLKEKVEYKLIEDIYADCFQAAETADEATFLNVYLKDKNFRFSGALDKIRNLPAELIYKEVYGMIFGKYEPSSPKNAMSREQYAEARAESFSRAECDTIYAIANDYAQFLTKNGLQDNNSMSRALLTKNKEPVYSVGVIDEVQDFTEVNLYLMKTLCRKLFCVGDALQMINPSYFSFAYLKRLMYGGVTGISELKHNFRSSEKLGRIADKLAELNRRKFGVHSFVLKGESVPSSSDSSAIFVRQRDFTSFLTDKKFENLTVIVSSAAKKAELRTKLKKTEILTVSEAKGLERETVILADVLSDNADKWQVLDKLTLSRKTADENSVFRYYFNLFYVGVSRARRYLIVSEYDYPESFEELFKTCFETKSKDGAINYLKEIAGKIELGDDELIERIEKFCSLGQYDNARFTADKLSTDRLRDENLAHIFVHENYLKFGKWREAGTEYWRRGMDKPAREMFTKSGDENLFPLMDACIQGGGALDADIVRFYPIVKDNELAKNIILETLEGDYKNLTKNQSEITRKLKRRLK